MSIRERDLIRQVQAGDPTAYAQLVRRYQKPLQRAACRILRDPDAAADVAQQTFIAAYENIHRYNPDHRFFSWLYRIACNGALNKLQRRQYLQPWPDADLPSPGPPPDAQVETRERIAFLADGMAALDYKYRVLLVLRHYLDFSYAEIARITEQPTSTVRSRMHTARVLLKSELTGRGFGE